MKKTQKNLLLQQIDKKIRIFSQFDDVVTPHGGWIKAVRTALKMSLRQFGKRLEVTSQAVKQIEDREADGSLTLKGLRQAANALDMKLVYGIISKEYSLEKMIEKKAREVARQIVMQTSHSMKLEDQENSSQRIEQAIKEKAEELKREMPRYLWD